jgi:hypothetical protein
VTFIARVLRAREVQASVLPEDAHRADLPALVADEREGQALDVVRHAVEAADPEAPVRGLLAAPRDHHRAFLRGDRRAGRVGGLQHFRPRLGAHRLGLLEAQPQQPLRRLVVEEQGAVGADQVDRGLQVARELAHQEQLDGRSPPGLARSTDGRHLQPGSSEDLEHPTAPSIRCLSDQREAMPSNSRATRRAADRPSAAAGGARWRRKAAGPAPSALPSRFAATATTSPRGRSADALERPPEDQPAAALKNRVARGIDQHTGIVS